MGLDEWTQILACLPGDRAFTVTEAEACGVPKRSLYGLRQRGLVRRLMPNLYVASHISLTIDVRADALRRVVPATAVATDETAAWLHGLDLHHPTEKLPGLRFFQTNGATRLRNGAVISGRRMLLPRDVMRVEGVLVTTPLRTALDLARVPGTYRALGVLDGLLRTETFTPDELLAEIPRFKGFRGVIQLRAIVSFADARSESMAESALRLHWNELPALPQPVPQLAVPGPNGPYYFDLAAPEIRYAAEYDGMDFHSSPSQKAYDEERRRHLVDVEDWTIDVFVSKDVYGRQADPKSKLESGIARAIAQVGLPKRSWRWPTMPRSL